MAVGWILLRGMVKDVKYGKISKLLEIYGREGRYSVMDDSHICIELCVLKIFFLIGVK